MCEKAGSLDSAFLFIEKGLGCVESPGRGCISSCVGVKLEILYGGFCSL